MDDSAPLKPALPAGIYRCTWFMPSEGDTATTVELTGEVDLSASGLISGSMEGDLPLDSEIDANGQQMFGFPAHRNFERLVARLVSGHEITVFNVEIKVWFMNRALLVAEFALLRARYSPDGADPFFTSIEMQVTGLDALVGAGPFSVFGFPANSDSDQLFSVQLSPGRTTEWSDGEVSMTSSYRIALTAGDAFYFRVACSPSITIELSKPISIDQVFTEWVRPIKSLATLAGGITEQVTFIALRGRDASGQQTSLMQLYGQGVTQEPFASRRKDYDLRRKYFSTNRDGLSLLAMVRAWTQRMEEHHPLFETYGTFLGASSEHPRFRLLLLLQALEGLYDYEHEGDLAAATQRHLAKREDVQSAVAQILKGSQWRFFKANLSKRPQTNLETRLEGVLLQLPKDLTPELAECSVVKDLAVDARNVDKRQSLGALRLLRNDLSHGTRGYPSEQLAEVSAILDKVARTHLLRLLGCAEAVLLASLVEHE